MRPVIDQIDRSLDVTAAIVDSLPADLPAVAAPCPGWTAQTELNHLVGGMRIFAAELTGTDAGRAHEDDWLGDDPRAAFAAAARLDRAAWQQPLVLERAVCLGFGAVPGPMAALIHLTEVLVHGTDLAVATGRRDLVDDDACAELFGIMCGLDFELFRTPGMFGPAVPVAAHAPAHEQLLAFLGRDLSTLPDPRRCTPSPR
jgi:uncharacterized protein (TIGR03086 family)